MRRRLVATAAMRSDSFTRNSFRVAHFDSLLGIRSDGSQYRNLVDQRSRVGPSDGRALQPSAFDLQRAHQFAVDLLQLSHRNSQPHLHEDVEQARARGIHQQIGDGKLRTREKSRRAKKECGAGNIAGNRRVNSLQPLAAANPHLVFHLFHLRTKRRSATSP